MNYSEFLELLFEFSFAATSWLQNSFPWLEGVMVLISQMGTFEFYLVLTTVLYWCVDKRAGRYLLFLLIGTAAINGTLKHIFHSPRPYWLRPELAIGDNVDYGFPSGHVQMGTVTYLFLANWLERSWASLLAIFMIVMMVISRIYLGVHFVHDTLIGFLLGILLVAIYAMWIQFGADRGRNMIMGQRLLIVVGVPFVYFIVYLLVRFFNGLPEDGLVWASFVDGAERETIENITTGFAGLFGMGVGLVFEQFRVGFYVRGKLYQRILRYLVGIVGAIAIWQGLKVVFALGNPQDVFFVAVFLRFIRYGLLGVWVAYYAPRLFVALGLADAGGSEIELTL